MRIGVVSVGRSDVGHLTPIVSRLTTERGLEPEWIEWRVLGGGDVQTITAAMELSFRHFREALEQRGPFDWLLIFGDRYEQYMAASAAVPYGIPILHYHGGETTRGAMDNRFRHAITQLAHLHAAATKESMARLLQTEESWRVWLSGCARLEHDAELRSKSDLASLYGLPKERPWILGVLHPETLLPDPEHTRWMTTCMCRILDQLPGFKILWTPNEDTNSKIIRAGFEEYTEKEPDSLLLSRIQPDHFLAFLRAGTYLVGNSSAGILEAPSYGIPTIDLGDRQKGRIRGANVIHADWTAESLAWATAWAMAASRLTDCRNPYRPFPHLKASEVICRMLRETPIDRRLLEKP